MHARGIKEFNGRKLESTTKDGFDLGDEDEKKRIEELKAIISVLILSRWVTVARGDAEHIKKFMLDRTEASKTQEDVESEREIRTRQVADVRSVVNSMHEVTRTCEMETVKVHLTEFRDAKFRQPHRSQQQQPVQGRRVEKGKEKQEEEGKEMGMESKKEKGRGKEERQDGKEGRERGGVEEVVEKDVMDGQSRNTRRRRS